MQKDSAMELYEDGADATAGARAERLAGPNRRVQVFRTAAAQFAMTGPHGTTRLTLAKAAGISEAILYVLLGNKAQLFRQAVEGNADAFKAIEAVIGDPPRDDRKFFDKLKNIVIDPQEKVGYVCRKTSDLHSDPDDERGKGQALGSRKYAAAHDPPAELLEFLGLCRSDHLGCTGEGARICVLRVTTPTLGRLEPPSFLDAFSPPRISATLAGQRGCGERTGSKRLCFRHAG